MSARAHLCTDCELLRRRTMPHPFLRVVDVPDSDRLWIFRCLVCAARWKLEGTGDGEEWTLTGSVARRSAG